MSRGRFFNAAASGSRVDSRVLRVLIPSGAGGADEASVVVVKTKIVNAAVILFSLFKDIKFVYKM